MYDDEERTTYPEREQHIFDEKLERDGGVLIEPQHSEVDCNQPGAECAPDEYPEDPYAVDNRPGTVDDVTYSFGVELPNADDQHLVPEGRPGVGGRAAPDEEVERELGERDERDLWRRQRPLMEEDSEEGVRLPEGASEEDGARVLDAMGAEFSGQDQAEESATGSAGRAEDWREPKE